LPKCLISCNLHFEGYKILNMNPGVVPAEKELRKKFIIFLVLATMAFLALEPHIKGQIDQLSKKHPE
jgi:hypothetical protein